MYKYFELNIVIVFDKCMATAKPVDKLALEKVEILQVWKTCPNRNQKQ